jgi:hypothetical protein
MQYPLLLAPLLLQTLAMGVDELVFHRKRRLPLWERVGHPLDTLTVAICYGWLVAASPDGPYAIRVYVLLSLVSCLFITKDEFVHARECEPFELWLHSVLFVLHPIVLGSLGAIWYSGTDGWVLKGTLVATLGLLLYQVVYWNFVTAAPKTGTL